MTSDDQNRILIIPWTPPSPRRRREIIQGEGERPCAMRPMRTEARAALTDALRDAHHWLDELSTSPNLNIESLAAREGKTERWIRRTISLALLCPALVKAAIDGRLPRGFGVKRLMDLPMDWTDQWSALGLRAPADADYKSERFAISLISAAAQSGTQNSASETHFRVRRPRPVFPAK
jgi:site-specific DNA recombinase